MAAHTKFYVPMILLCKFSQMPQIFTDIL